jgi:hypothetical protein
MSRMEANLKANDARIMTLCGRLYHKVGKLLQGDIGGKMDYLVEAELTARAATTADELDDTPEYAKCGRCHAGTLVYGADLGNAEFGRTDTNPFAWISWVYYVDRFLGPKNWAMEHQPMLKSPWNGSTRS